MKQIRVYHTHIEIEPYKKGDLPDLEKSLSTYDKIYRKHNPIAYHIEDGILYIPRGINPYQLEYATKSNAKYIKDFNPYDKIDIYPKISPKDEIQEKCINFLMCENEFTKGREYSQFGLNPDTDSGKTIACLLAIASKYKCKTLVIVHRVNIGNVWVEEIKKATSLNPEDILLMKTSDMVDIIENGSDKKFFITTHQSIGSLARQYGWKKVTELMIALRIGIKIIDEAHESFHSTMMIDFFSNIHRNWYVTATFKRSNYFEKIIYKRAFGNTYRYGEELMDHDANRKHIIYNMVSFNSSPENGMDQVIKVGGYLNSGAYTNYALHIDERRMMLLTLKKIVDRVKHYRGKILVLSSTIDSTEIVAKYLMEHFNREVYVINSQSPVKLSDITSDYVFISSTMKSLGTGVNISQLRVIISMELFRSELLIHQLKGRLRELSATDNTFIFDLYDRGFQEISDMALIRKRQMKKFANRVEEIYM